MPPAGEASAQPEFRSRTWRRAIPAAVLCGYAGLSFAYFGWPLAAHPGRVVVGTSASNDAQTFIWSFAWWPHAILSGINPLFSHVVYAPTGVDLAWVTSVPALALAFSPLTLLFGPTVSYNAAALLLPALSAWSAFFLFRYLTRSLWAAVLGGYFYGFSSYELGQQLAGDINLTAVFLLPLLALVVVRHLRGELRSSALAGWVAVLVALQAYTSVEIAVTETIMLALGLAAAFLVAPNLRTRLGRAVLPLGAGYLLAGVLAAPLIYYALEAIIPFSISYPWVYGADPLNLVIPTSVTELSGKTLSSIASHFRGNDYERDSYLGLPLILMAALQIARRPRDSGTRFLVIGFVVATFCSFGTALYVDGQRLFWLPWAPISHLIGTKNVTPSRLALFATFAVDTLAVFWIATSKGRIFRRAYVLPVLAAAALAPSAWGSSFWQNPQRVPFFATGIYRSCFPRGETLLVFPFGRWGNSLLWQAEAGFYFNIAEGTLGPNDLPTSFTYDTTVAALLYNGNPIEPGTADPTMPELLGLIDRRRVERVVSTTSAGMTSVYPDASQMRAFGEVEVLDGAIVSPRCGAPPIGSGATSGQPNSAPRRMPSLDSKQRVLVKVQNGA